ncbi:unnamed protein product [Thlaspi arvense]|uniref:F-box associated beta-propeller type 3 domain-containing protein n=1 Tax=Thlaspi arvense TaxID=13288 RepID=A0AAU9RIW9_THLAR|nr:unnamed protein product [Thlaspi arvense]
MIVVSLISVFSWPDSSPWEVTSENWVFDLKAGGGSWKKADLTPPDSSPPQVPLRGGVCIDGVIYYLAWIDFKAVVVSFNIRSEEFNMIQVPPRDGDEDLNFTNNLGILERGGKGVVALWTLEDVGSKKWSCKSRMHLVSSITFLIRGTTQKGKVLLKPEKLLSPFHILCYDLQSNDMRKIEIKGIPDHWFGVDKNSLVANLMFMDQSESVRGEEETIDQHLKQLAALLISKMP